jgi:hypothetical protein
MLNDELKTSGFDIQNCKAILNTKKKFVQNSGSTLKSS